MKIIAISMAILLAGCIGKRVPETFNPPPTTADEICRAAGKCKER